MCNYPFKGVGVRSEKYARYITYHRDLLRQGLEYLGQSEQEHRPALQYEMFDKIGLLIDLHSFSTFPREPLKGMPLTYIGYVSGQREIMINGKGHLFLYCSSNVEGKYGGYYPEKRDSVLVFTSGCMTWIDNSYLQMIAPRCKNTFDSCGIELLRRIKEVGEEAYNALSSI